jgi:hypothetical protein
VLHVNVGTNLYGRVLNVPGVLYVATVFQHVAFIPLAPVGSWLVVEEPGLGKFLRRSTTWRGIPLAAPVWRSVFAAWGRAALVLFALWHLVAEGYHAATHWEPVDRAWLAAAVVALAVAAVAGRFGRARIEQVEPLLEMADAPDDLARRVEQAFGQPLRRRWAGRGARSAPVAGEALDAWTPEEDSGEAPEPSADESQLALTFAQRHAPRFFAAFAIPLGLFLSAWERHSALRYGSYHPKLLTAGFVLVACGVPALLFNIGRDRDLKVPWKVAVLVGAGLVGLVAAIAAPAWFF